jgi:hypothetical protein
VQVRKGDGLHFCPSGAARVAAALLPALQQWWSLAPAPGWDTGGWRQDERYVHPLNNTPCG